MAAGQFAVTAVLARFLSPDDFGLVAGANILITLVQMLAEGGLGAAIVQSQRLTPEFIGAAFAVAAVIASLCFVATLLLAVPYESLLKMEGLAAIVAVLGIGFFLIGPGGVCEGVIQRAMEFRALFLVNVLTTVVGYALPAIWLAVAGYGVWAIVIATLTRMAARLVLLLLVARGRLVLGWNRETTREVLHFGVGLTQDRFWNWLSAQTAPLVIGRLIGQSQLGQFYLASQLAILPLQHIATALSSVFLPVMSRAAADRVRLTEIFIGIGSVALVGVIGLGSLMLLGSSVIVDLALGPEWASVVPLFEVLCIGACLRACVQLSDALNIARGRVFALANRRAASTGVLVVLMLLTYPYGLHAVTWAVVAGQLAMLILTLNLARESLDLSGSGVRSTLSYSVLAIAAIVVINTPLFFINEAPGVSEPVVLAVAAVLNALVFVVLLMRLDSISRDPQVKDPPSGACS